MTKCKFCKNQAFVSIRKYDYNKFGVCRECLQWILIELDYAFQKEEHKFKSWVGPKLPGKRTYFREGEKQ